MLLCGSDDKKLCSFLEAFHDSCAIENAWHSIVWSMNYIVTYLFSVNCALRSFLFYTLIWYWFHREEKTYMHNIGLQNSRNHVISDRFYRRRRYYTDKLLICNSIGET